MVPIVTVLKRTVLCVRKLYKNRNAMITGIRIHRFVIIVTLV